MTGKLARTPTLATGFSLRPNAWIDPAAIDERIYPEILLQRILVIFDPAEIRVVLHPASSHGAKIRSIAAMSARV